MTIEQKVWQTLSAIDVSSFTEKKQNLTYLSWAHAYAIFNQHFPAHDYGFYESMREDGTVMIECRLSIRDGEESMTRTGWLPCLDYRNQAISHPNAMQVNTTRMRCLVKTLGLMGLGLNIYQGEDLPVAEAMLKDEPIDAKQLKSLENMIGITDTDLDRFLAAYKIGSLAEMKKSRFNHAIDTLNRKRKMQNEEAISGTAD